MNVDDGTIYRSKEEAIAAGEKEENLVTGHPDAIRRLSASVKLAMRVRAQKRKEKRRKAAVIAKASRKTNR